MTLLVCRLVGLGEQEAGVSVFTWIFQGSVGCLISVQFKGFSWYTNLDVYRKIFGLVTGDQV